MKTQFRHLARLNFLLLLPLAGFAQSAPSLSGSYASLAIAKQSDSFGETGGAILSVLNFDGAGNVSGTAVLKGRTGAPSDDGTTGPTAVEGTYTTNSDGSGSLALNFTDFGFSAKLAMVITDGGKSIQFADGPGSTGPLSINPNFPGTMDKVTGTVPGGYFLQSFLQGVQATGTIPLTLDRTYNNAGISIYTLASPASGSGPVTCPDGSAGTWSATIPSTTAILKSVSGNFMMPVAVSACGDNDTSNYTGLANVNFTPTGINLVLHLTGFFITGSGRATTGGAPKGVYGVQNSGEPFPNANLQIMNFDGSGGVTMSLIGAAGTTAFAGTYTTNSDGSGTVTLAQSGNAAAAPLTVAYAVADNGSTIFLLRTSGGGGGIDVISGVGHLQ